MFRRMFGERGNRRARLITSVSEYEGESSVAIAATQLGTEFTRAQAAKIVAEWCVFFSSGPSPIRSLSFTSRTPNRLFETLGRQTQLECLEIKWGDYVDLNVLAGMESLHKLTLGGASCVKTLEPLTSLGAVRCLTVESLQHVHDLTPLGGMRGVVDLMVGGDWIRPRSVHVESIAFLRQMQQLRRLVLHTLIVDDRDYSPLLDLPHLKELRVERTRGMRPTWEQLAVAIPILD